jgi:hypothetical protein
MRTTPGATELVLAYGYKDILGFRPFFEPGISGRYWTNNVRISSREHVLRSSSSENITHVRTSLARVRNDESGAYSIRGGEKCAGSWRGFRQLYGPGSCWI